jgi:putative ABC transport system permease protein
MLTDFWFRLRAILGFGAGDRDLDDELAFHVDREIDKLAAAGLSRREATRRAHLAFGGVEQVKEHYRDTRGIRPAEWLFDIARETRHAVRMLAKTPAFTAVAVLSLALGIGANAAMFSVVDAELLRPLPVPRAAAVVTIGTDGPDDRGSGVSYPNYRDLRERSRSFEGVVAYRRSTLATFARSHTETRQLYMGMLVSDNFFDALGVQPALGRKFTPEEGAVPGRDAVVVLGHDFWTNALAADPSVLGRTILLNGIDFTVIGVAPQSFTGMDESVPAFFAPIMMAERLSGSRERVIEDRSARTFAVKGRLGPGVSRTAAHAELATRWSGLLQQYPDANRNLSIAVRSQLQERVREEGPVTTITLAMMMALVAVVLIIACANVASLMLGRNRARSREVAIRLALGVSPMRLLRQLLIESLVLASAGCALGLAFAYAGVRLLQAARSPADLRIVVAPQLDERVLIVSLLASVASAVLFGLAPAWQSLKTQLVPALKSAEPGQTARHRTFGRSALVVTQVALAMVLLVVTAGLLDGFRKILRADPGFRTDHLLMATLDTSVGGRDPNQTQSFYQRLEERTRELPGTTSAALTSWVALDRGGDMTAVAPEGYSIPRGRETVRVYSAIVSERYFDTMRIGIIGGRAFTPDDRKDSHRVAIVNEEFAKTYWPGQDAIGKRLRMNGNSAETLEVVGLTKTGKYLFLAEPPTPFLYLPFAQHQRTAMALLVETASRDAATLAAPVRELVRDLDPAQPVVNIRTYASLYEARGLLVPLIVLRLVGVMGGIGLALALMGLYGLVAYSVAQRTRELGLRMAIGAARSDVVKMVLRQGFMLAIKGIGLGGIASVGVARVLAAGMAGLGAPNPANYIAVPVVLIGLTLAASYLPARRASAVDPLVALRDD